MSRYRLLELELRQDLHEGVQGPCRGGLNSDFQTYCLFSDARIVMVWIGLNAIDK